MTIDKLPFKVNLVQEMDTGKLEKEKVENENSFARDGTKSGRER